MARVTELVADIAFLPAGHAAEVEAVPPMRPPSAGIGTDLVMTSKPLSPGSPGSPDVPAGPWGPAGPVAPRLRRDRRGRSRP